MRVLVTRPRQDAERTARRLVALGHEAVVAPLMEVVATGVPMPDGPFDAVILTSAHAVPALATLPALATRPVPVFAVGERTAAAARQAGFEQVRSGPGDAAALARSVADGLRSPAILLHIAGRHRKPEPEATLRARGYALRVWEAYEARAVTALPDEALAELGAGRIDLVLHYSRRSAALLVGLADEAGLGPQLRVAMHLCLSGDAAAPLVACGASAVVAQEPDEAALLAMIETLPERSLHREP
jgi:uroporphyrinogen-III synthase